MANSVALCYIEWTTEGCQTTEVNDSVVICNCNHLTNFAILMVSICCMSLLAGSVNWSNARAVGASLSECIFQTWSCIHFSQEATLAEAIVISFTYTQSISIL